MKKTRSNIVQKPQGTSRPPEADFTFCGAKVAPFAPCCSCTGPLERILLQETIKEGVKCLRIHT
jgi:hypothetical protein